MKSLLSSRVAIVTGHDSSLKTLSPFYGGECHNGDACRLIRDPLIPESQTPTFPDHSNSPFRILPRPKPPFLVPTLSDEELSLFHMLQRAAYDRRSVSQRLKTLPGLFPDRIRARPASHISDFSHSRFDNKKGSWCEMNRLRIKPEGY